MRILLVAPNASRLMGGEALKALQIALELLRRGHQVMQITHARVRDELTLEHPTLQVAYLEDTTLQRCLHRTRLQMVLNWLNGWQLHRLAASEAIAFAADVVHFTAPISPVLPYFSLRTHPVVIGPLNGNLSYPLAFRSREPFKLKALRLLLHPGQAFLGFFARGKREAHLLVAGGERTILALRAGGCSPDRMMRTIDCGLEDAIMDLPRAMHDKPNYRFVFLGRLVSVKACDLVLKALALAPREIELDVIGDGAERSHLEALVADLGLRNRVRFLGYLPPTGALHTRLQRYRGLVMPSLAEANGIVFQEAMAIGLPVIAIDWAGVRELLTKYEAMLISPDGGEKIVVERLAAAMTCLSTDYNCAEELSARARRRADHLHFRWSDVLADWERLYSRAMAEHAMHGASDTGHQL